jgi:nucleotide-binding universal stress UspA family protein
MAAPDAGDTVIDTVIVAIDGSEASRQAAQTGLALLDPRSKVVIATVVEQNDPSLTVGGSGFAGGVMSAEELQDVEDARIAEAHGHLHEAAEALDVPDAETLVVRGSAGPALCDLAVERRARAIVIGSRGRAGIKRALLGSVSDFVARNAPCPVVISRPAD